MNKLRDMLENGKKIKGTLCCLTDPAICEIFGNVGFDCVWIDMEHTYMSTKEVLCHLNAARSSGISSLVRVPQDDLTFTKKVMELGPDAMLFPFVQTKEETERLIKYTLYPPDGTRGFGPMRAIKYGGLDAKEYSKNQSFEMLRFVQIESKNFIDELPEIVKIPHLDGFVFGPNDLSGSINEFLDVFGENTVNEINRAMKIIKENGKYVGLAGGMDEATVKFWSQFDFDMIFAGGDWNYIFDASKKTLGYLKDNFSK